MWLLLSMQFQEYRCLLCLLTCNIWLLKLKSWCINILSKPEMHTVAHLLHSAFLIGIFWLCSLGCLVFTVYRLWDQNVYPLNRIVSYACSRKLIFSTNLKNYLPLITDSIELLQQLMKVSYTRSGSSVTWKCDVNLIYYFCNIFY